METNKIEDSNSDYFEKFLEVFGSKTCAIGRNDFCYCGSGKKYKKCCGVAKQPAAPTSVDFELSYAPFEKENNPLEATDQKLVEELYHMITFHPDRAKHRTDEYKTLLDHLIEKYPQKPFLWNYLGIVHSINSETEQMEKVVYETVKRFPDYLFGLTGLAMINIRKGNLEQAFEILKGSHTLPQLYPHRRKFHISEVEAFHHTLIHYHCAASHLEAAEAHLKLLRAVSEREELMESATHAIQLCRMKHNFLCGLNRLKKNAQKKPKKAGEKQVVAKSSREKFE
jgi:hypothetical protein